MRTAVVVGAGVAGLAAAGALVRAGWRVTLIERGERLRGTGTAQILPPNGVAALRALGVHLGDLAFPAPSGGIRRPDGRVLVEPPLRAGHAPTVRSPLDGGSPPEVRITVPPDVRSPGAEPADQAGPTPMAAPVRSAPDRPGLDQPVVLHADDLHDLLLAALGDKIEIRTGIEVTAVVTSGVDWPAVTAGKHTFTADLVVAADGAGSVIRQRVAPGSRVTPAGYTAWRAVVPWFRAPRLPDDVPPTGEVLGAGMRFAYATLGLRRRAGEPAGLAGDDSNRGGVYWYATAPGAPRPESLATQLGLLRRWFAGWSAPVTELLAATQVGDLVPQPAVRLAELPERFGFRVGGGGVVLVGDAAHPITPSLTQGACLALEDAVVLGGLMRDAVPGEDIAARLDEYTRRRRDRARRLDRMARRLDRLVQAQGRLSVAARDALLPRLATRVLTPALAAAADWTP
jgi:2-polyprenyl-6-methoxyphenol hydroxylase-like FAD-dependent oxidoreductase